MDWLSTMDPNDDLAWQAVADWLEENAQPQRAELLRLTRMLCRDPSCPDRKRHEARQMELLAQGVEPFVLSHDELGRHGARLDPCGPLPHGLA